MPRKHNPTPRRPSPARPKAVQCWATVRNGRVVHVYMRQAGARFWGEDVGEGTVIPGTFTPSRKGTGGKRRAK